MQKEAIYHQPYGSYAYPLAEDRLFLQLRAKKNELEEVHLLYDGRFDWVEDSPRYELKMEKYCSDKLFDYFRAEISLAYKKFRYAFLLNDGDHYTYYTEFGFKDSPPLKKDSFEYTYICENDLFTTPSWVHNAIFYQIFPERFANGDPALNPDNIKPWSDREPESDSFYGGDLAGIIDKLDYLAELGINAIYLTPVFPSSSNHKYNIRDYKAVDPQFGDLKTAKELVNKAHQKGIKVIFDAVFNHSSNQFFAFKDLREQGADSEYRDWYYVDDLPVKEHPSLNFATLNRFFAKLEDLAQQKRLTITEISNNFLPELGIDYQQLNGYEQEFLELLVERYNQNSRLRHLKAKELWFFIQNDDQLSSLMRPNYEAFANGAWAMPKLRTSQQEVRDYLLEVGEFWIKEVGIDGWRLDVADEVSHDFWREFRRVVKAAKDDAYIVGEVWKDSTRWLNGDQFDGVMNYVFSEAVLDFFCRRKIDADNFAHRLTKVRTSYKLPAQLGSLNLIDSHDTPRALTVAESDKERLKLAAAFQLTYLGAPMIYYGDEVGLEGGEDPDCRRTMLWQESQQDSQLLAWYQKLIKLRRENQALKTGDIKLLTANPARNIYAFARVAGDNKLVVAFNNSNLANKLKLDLGQLKLKTNKGQGLLAEEEYLIKDNNLELEIDAYSVAIVKF